MRRDVLKYHAGLFLSLFGKLAFEPDKLLSVTLFDYLVKTVKSSSADEKNVFGIDLNEFLIRVLSAALRRHIRHRSLKDFEQCLLNTLSGYIACDRTVFAFTRDLIYLVDVYDTFFGTFYIIVRSLYKTEKDILNILAHISRFGKRRCIGYCKGHLERLRQCLCKICLADTGGTYEQNIAFLDLNVIFIISIIGIFFAFSGARLRRLAQYPLVMIVNRDRKRDLGFILTNDISVKRFFYLPRLWQFVIAQFAVIGTIAVKFIFVNYLIACPDAEIANEKSVCCGYQKITFLFRPAAKGTAVNSIVTFGWHILLHAFQKACHRQALTQKSVFRV